MDFTHRVPQMLHDEHMATIALLERVEALASSRRSTPPDPAAPGFASLLREFTAMIEGEVTTHFAFEENVLFPLLAGRGETDIGELLREEHDVLRELGVRLVTLARCGAAEGFSAEAWREFRSLAAELSERMLSHVQKEEMALLPVVDDAVDPDTDAVLATDYAQSR